MNISENIKWIMDSTKKWQLYTNKSYKAKIQLASSSQIYNVPDKAGVVYNCLEDSYEKVGDKGYVVTGLAGEMWPIGESAVKKYNVNPSSVTLEPKEVDTVETDTVYAGIRIPLDTKFTLEVDYGEKAILKGNRESISHGQGDYVLVATRLIDSKYQPNFEDYGRIVNGEIFNKLYKAFEG